MRFRALGRESSPASKRGMSRLWAGGARREGSRGICQPPSWHTPLLGDVVIPLFI